MKLLKVYVENFGKISKTEYDFDGNLTAFCYENGYGKTTLATFIKVMFYGMPTVKTNSKFNDREHYYPFDGGKFGGNLTFEKDGKIYKIVRFFDKKSDTKDEVFLYENDSELKTLPENLGKWVFGVDEASFLRTLYFSETSLPSEKSSDITFKLTGVVDSNDDESFQNAKKQLEEAQKKLKKTGNKGEIADLKKEILNVKEDLENLKSIDNSLSYKYGERANLLNQLDVEEKRLKTVSDLKIKQENFNVYERYLSEAYKAKEELKNLTSKYPLKMPTIVELNALNESAENISNLNKENAYNQVDVDRVKKYEAVKTVFDKGVPTNSDIENLKKDVNDLSSIKNNKKTVKNVPLLLIGLLEVVVAIALIFLNAVAGIMFLCVGASFIVSSFLIKFKSEENAVNDLELKIKRYLKSYNIETENLLDGVYELKKKIDDYISISNELSQKEERKISINERYNKNIEIIKEIFKKYGILLNLENLKEQIKEIEKDYLTINNKKQIYDSAVKRAESYKEEKGLEDKPIGLNSYDEVNLTCKKLREQISVIDRDIKNGEDLLETYEDKKVYLKDLEEKLEKLVKRYQDITLTLDYLLKAEETLKNKYVNPVKKDFLNYSTKLEKVLGEKVIMDKNFGVYFEKSGENKSREYLSTGQNILCDLCLRLALLDNMYKEENPFIILDDPFVSLDANHVEKALSLIKELSFNRQIIYFTCHESRNL